MNRLRQFRNSNILQTPENQKKRKHNSTCLKGWSLLPLVVVELLPCCQMSFKQVRYFQNPIFLCKGAYFKKFKIIQFVQFVNYFKNGFKINFDWCKFSTGDR